MECQNTVYYVKDIIKLLVSFTWNDALLMARTLGIASAIQYCYGNNNHKKFLVD
jgi:hypothetical protein